MDLQASKSHGSLGLFFDKSHIHVHVHASDVHSCCVRVVLSVKDIMMTSVFMMLCKCCNHPYLLEFPLTLDGDFFVDEQLVTSCGKVLLLDDNMLSALIKRGL